MRREAPARIRRRIPAQRHDMPHARLPVLLGDFSDLGLAGTDAGQVRGRHQFGFAHDPLNRRMGALAGRAACTIGHRDEARRQGSQLDNRLPQLLFHLLGFGREEFEGDINVAARGREVWHC